VGREVPGSRGGAEGARGRRGRAAEGREARPDRVGSRDPQPLAQQRREARREVRAAGPGVAENMMSGQVIVDGDASQYAGATGHGGFLVIKGNASSRCGISMKGIDIVVHGNVGHMSAFMAQKGNLVVLGDAGEALGDSLYEARLFVRGTVKSLGADCIEKEMRPEHLELLADLLKQAGADGKARPEEFTRYGSARKLYNFNIDNADAY
jgi:glutamate synthase domain-containing protein 3